MERKTSVISISSYSRVETKNRFVKRATELDMLENIQLLSVVALPVTQRPHRFKRSVRTVMVRVR